MTSERTWLTSPTVLFLPSALGTLFFLSASLSLGFVYLAAIMLPLLFLGFAYLQLYGTTMPDGTREGRAELTAGVHIVGFQAVFWLLLITTMRSMD